MTNDDRSRHAIAHDALGTRLRALLDRMEEDIGALERDLGLGVVDFRPRFSPVMRILADGQARSIRAIAEGIGVTHSAASQTVAQLERRELVTRERGDDGRERRVRLSGLGASLLPAVEREWHLTIAAVASLDRELPVPLVQMIDALEDALDRQPFRDRFPNRPAPEDAGRAGPSDGISEQDRAGRPGSGSP